MTPYPASLFKDGAMRSSDNKAVLKNNILNAVEPREVVGSKAVAYDKASLWSCYLPKNENLKKILKRYVEKFKKLHVDIVVFDRYESSP